MMAEVVDLGTGEIKDAGEGKSIEEMPFEELDRSLDGTQKQTSLEFGSEYSVAHSTLKIKAPPVMTVNGQFRDGDKVKVTIEVEVYDVTFPPIKDRTGNKLGIERKHLAEVIDWEAAS
jgi:hypothetical protein